MPTARYQPVTIEHDTRTVPKIVEESLNGVWQKSAARCGGSGPHLPRTTCPRPGATRTATQRTPPIP